MFYAAIANQLNFWLCIGYGLVFLEGITAYGTLTDGVTTTSLVFRFDAEGRVSTVRAEARYRTVGKTLVATPWEGRFWDYGFRDGMSIPLKGEVAWQLPERSCPYWKGRILDIQHEFEP